MNYNLYKLEFHFFTFTWHPIYYTVLYVLVDDTGHSRDNGAKHWFYWFIVLSCIGAESPSTFSTPSQSTPFPINPKWSKRPSKNDSINWHSISKQKWKFIVTQIWTVQNFFVNILRDSLFIKHLSVTREQKLLGCILQDLPI